jgi:hypothetical protein
MSFGVENVDYGPTIKTGWYANVIIEHLVIISDSYSQGLTTPENSYPIFWGTTGKTAIAIMSLINGLPARSGLTPFIDPGPAMTWLQSEGKYGILNRTYENIVVSGLTLLYDAGTTLSYPLIDTTVYDLTSGNNDGTLVNGVTYLDTDGGIFNFSSASQQYISFADLGSLSNFTVGCWFNLDSIPNINEYPSLVTDIDSGGNSNYNLGFLATPWDGKITGGFKSNNTWYYPNGFTATTNQWYYVVVSYDGSNVKLYVDGYLYSQTSVAQSAVSSNSGGYIGRSWNGLNYINGNIGIVQIYDRALQSSEIYQNYSSQAPRFSIVLPTPTPTQTVVPTPTPTPTVTQTLTPTSTQQSTPTPTPTITQTQTPTLTQTSTPAQTSTPTPT